jgi:beta-glucanase (GH16 family)
MKPTSYRSLLLFVLAASAALAFSGCDGDGPRSVSSRMEPPAELTLAWSDEFNGPTLDATKWNIETGYGDNGWGNDEWQNYTSDPANLRIENGDLIITARSNGTLGKRDGSITSARITTENKLNVRFGKIMARIRVPESEATWPALWALGASFRSVGWPRCGEIDIMEILNRYSDIYTTHATVHWWNEDKNPPNASPPALWDFVGGSRGFDLPLSDDYHVYEAERTAENIIFRIDGITVYVLPIDMTMGELADEFFLLLNIAIGGTHGADPNATNFSTPQEMRVDWVRVYAEPGEWRDPPDPSRTERGIVSETHTNPMLPYNRIINTIEWSANPAASNVESTAVTPLDGNHVMTVVYEAVGAWGGGPVFEFESADFTSYLSGYGTYNALVFSLHNSFFSTYADIAIEVEDTHGDPANGIPGNKAAVRLIDYQPVDNSEWKTYTIPLADFSAVNPAVDLTSLKLLMFLTPVDAPLPGGVTVSGTFHFDDIHLAQRCFGADGQIQLRSASLEAADTSTWVTVVDGCEAGKTVPVTVSNGTDSISVDVALDTNGQGSGQINFGATSDATDTIFIVDGDTLTASFVDRGGTGSTRTDSASVVNSRNLVGDDDGDGAVYLYATDPAEEIDLDYNTDYFVVQEWGSGSMLDNAHAGDATFSPVFQVIPGGWWGTSAGVLAFSAFAVGFPSNYDTMRFKFKGAPEFNIKYAGGGGPNDDEITFSTRGVYARDLGDGWYEFSIRLSMFTAQSMSAATEFAFLRFGPETVLITDIHYE